MAEPLRALGELAGADGLTARAARLGGRLGDLLATLADEAVLAGARGFLDATLAPAGEPTPGPLDRLAEGMRLAPLEVDLAVLAGLAEEHEGYAQILRWIHPEGTPVATAGLAMQLLAPAASERLALRALLEDGRAVRSGIVELVAGPPFPERALRLADGLWSALHGIAAWPEPFALLAGPPDTAGLDEWLESMPAARAVRALERGLRATVLVSGDSLAAAHDRASALAQRAGVPFARLRANGPLEPRHERALSVHAIAAGAVPVLRVDAEEGDAPALASHPGPAVVCVAAGVSPGATGRPLIAVDVEPLAPGPRRAMWRAALPALAAQAGTLARLYRVEPAVASAVASDVRAVEVLDGRHAAVEDVAASLRGRTGLGRAGGVLRVPPRAGWHDLVLPPERLRQLREALDRQLHQRTVLEEWGFLGGRPGARGVRLMFAGPPGTGKTLSAEVLAGALGVDLLAVDLSRIVSKWLGETERNLAAAFDAAERSHAVLLFDEADALFGKRTEISDAHDRYANLETAYLLSRLERFEGLAILATNLRRNIDPAFARRLEFVIPYEEPGPAERERLWRVHLPAGAPLADDLDPAALALRYPVVGALIRNAAVAAAFLAASEGRPIGAEHVLRALRREYEKAGRAYSGPFPPEPREEVRLGAQDTG
jgi:hypothetical protein